MRAQGKRSVALGLDRLDSQRVCEPCRGEINRWWPTRYHAHLGLEIKTMLATQPAGLGFHISALQAEESLS